ncbi:hypothetical protein [Desulfonema magnum]|uniref:Uncharacterized protein n=1 Tax=Desulfonema magnum TaxID=45655 RepID=A0A975BH96_9BACT|nr:hypothetical protein [Desulfonema magnum]QTA85411.1 Uncharacterized protein dnm_014200 [Desulfonema magnum]
MKDIDYKRLDHLNPADILELKHRVAERIRWAKEEADFCRIIPEL